MKYKYVYFNESNQKVWRTNTSIGEVPIEFELLGSMTKAEFDLLIEVLFWVFEEEDISLENFQRVFGDIRTFCDIIKKIVDEV